MIDFLPFLRRSGTVSVETLTRRLDDVERRLSRCGRSVHFVHCVEFRNRGDMNCCPYFYFSDYFDQFPCMIHNIWDVQFSAIRHDDIVILGGGGLFDCLDGFQETINRLCYVCRNVIAWGVGHNTHEDRQLYWQVEYERFRLLSVRDYDYPGQSYCPDVSCMMKGLERRQETRRRIGLISHQEYDIELPFEKITHKDRLEVILDFIAGSEVLVTNTYHCAYWGMLMGKKVILYKPFSSKFRWLRHKPVVWSGDLEADVQASRAFPGFMEESRDITLKFFARVRNIVEERP